MHLQTRENLRIGEFKIRAEELEDAQAKADKDEVDEDVARRTTELNARDDKCKMQEFLDSDMSSGTTATMCVVRKPNSRRSYILFVFFLGLGEGGSHLKKNLTYARKKMKNCHI